MRQITEWRNAVKMPVIAEPIKWNLNELEEILKNSIKQCAEESFLTNGLKICITLSGGLDSSFLLAKIHEVFRTQIPVHAFTLAGSKEHPDFKFSKLISTMFSANHHARIPNGGDIKEAEHLLSAHRSLVFPGDVGVFLLYKYMREFDVKCVIAGDGIDELLGGYWAHRQRQDLDKKARVFRMFWSELREKHLIPLEETAKQFGIKVVFPYLQAPVIDYISRIPLEDRTSLEKSKSPLREIAFHHLPLCVIKREKKGFCDALNQK